MPYLTRRRFARAIAASRLLGREHDANGKPREASHQLGSCVYAEPLRKRLDVLVGRRWRESQALETVIYAWSPLRIWT
jgi:hypothetical protein